MKVWNGYGTEHSANLVIIGTFKTLEDTQAARQRIEDLTKIVNDEYHYENSEKSMSQLAFGRLSDRILDYYSVINVGGSNFELQGLVNEYNLQQKDKELIITTNDTDINAFVSYMIGKGAKIKIYSAHNYKSEYGRPTYEGTDKA